MPVPELPDALTVARQRRVAMLTAVLFALGWHLWVGDAHLNAAEEGYLWYGTWRAGLGELPLRDFQSYDPGRYLACAALGKLFGAGLLGLRRSLAVFQGLGLLFGLLAARRATQKAWPLVPIGVVLGLWLFPRHKIFEGVLALAAVWVGTCLLERPTRARHLAAGACAGLAAFFGRNHGLYAAVGLGALALLCVLRMRERDWLRKGAAFAGGIVLGYSPMLALFLFAPGFWQGFVHSMQLLLRLGANIDSPWLWPWRVELDGGALAAAAEVSLALVYLLPFVVLPLGLWRFARTKAEELAPRAMVLVATVLGLVYLHHASVRSDSSHLAQSIQPTLLCAVGLLGELARHRKRLATLLALVLAVPVGYAGFEHNPATTHIGRVRLVSTQLGGDRIRLLPQHADYYERLQRTLEARLAPEDRIFFAPSRPAFYPLFQRRSPSWWIYFFVPESTPEEQESIVQDLADVKWVLIVDQAIAEREDLRFQNSYPLVWSYIQASYQRVPTPQLEGNHLLYKRRE